MEISESDDLADHYRIKAEDTSEAEKAREAAKCFVSAEENLSSLEGALKSASEALALFRDASDTSGVADALRLITRINISQDKLKEALVMTEEDLDTFKKSGDQEAQQKCCLPLQK